VQLCLHPAITSATARLQGVVKFLLWSEVHLIKLRVFVAIDGYSG